MDSRHESHEQEVLNEIIHAINLYMQANIEELLTNTALRNDIKSIASVIYTYAQKWTDIEGVFSNKNFLSVDVVLLPMLDEALKPEADFSDIINHIAAITQHGKTPLEFYKNIQGIISKAKNAT